MTSAGTSPLFPDTCGTVLGPVAAGVGDPVECGAAVRADQIGRECGEGEVAGHADRIPCGFGTRVRACVEIDFPGTRTENSTDDAGAA